MNVAVMSARKARGLSQLILAKRLAVNHVCVGLIEVHDWIPPKAVRTRLAKELKKDEAELFGPTIAQLP